MATIKKTKDTEVRFEKVELIEENGKYYLSVVYDVETDLYVRRFRIPKINLGINTRYCYPELTKETDRDSGYPLGWNMRFRCGEKIFDLEYGKVDGVNAQFTEEIIEAKTQKLTISEIEKKLGYKIEIVAEKEDKK